MTITMYHKDEEGNLYVAHEAEYAIDNLERDSDEFVTAYSTQKDGSVLQIVFEEHEVAMFRKV